MSGDNIHFKSDEEIQLEINEPTQLEFVCKELLFTDVDSKYTVKFTLDKEIHEGLGIKDFSKIQKLIWKFGDMEYTFSQVRVEDRSKS